jgi:hypothetical protein
MAGCQVLRCPNPSADRFVSADARVTALVCEEHKRALDAGERWDCTGRDGSILMGPDLAPALADYLVGGRGNGVTLTIERMDDDHPFSVWLSHAEAARLGQLLLAPSGPPPSQGQADPEPGRRRRDNR